jgi:hypothetical protein
VSVLSRVWTVMRRCGFKTFTPLPPSFEGGEGNVPSSALHGGSAAAIDAQVGEFGVATGGGIWVAAGDECRDFD